MLGRTGVAVGGRSEAWRNGNHGGGWWVCGGTGTSSSKRKMVNAKNQTWHGGVARKKHEGDGCKRVTVTGHGDACVSDIMASVVASAADGVGNGHCGAATARGGVILVVRPMVTATSAGSGENNKQLVAVQRSTPAHYLHAHAQNNFQASVVCPNTCARCCAVNLSAAMSQQRFRQPMLTLFIPQRVVAGCPNRRRRGYRGGGGPSPPPP